MDLLGHYSSSDDDDSSNSSKSSHSSKSYRSKSPPPAIRKSTMFTASGPSRPSATKKQSNTKTAATATATKTITSAPTDTTTATTSRRGKKLISLHSVLPPHILEQLTKSEATGSFDDSSDDGDDINRSISEQQPSKANSKNNKKAASQDEGIANFLSALSSAKSSNSKGNKLKSTSTNASNTDQKNQPSSSSSSSSRLGDSFLSVTSTTTTRKKDGTTVSTTKISAPRTTNANTSNGNDERRTPTGQVDPTAGGGNASPSNYQPLSLSPRTAFRPFRTSASMTAAPPVPSVPAIAVNRTIAAAPPVSASQQQKQAPTNNNSYQATATAHDRSNRNINNYKPRSKKRQLQKALRAGQLDQVEATMNMEQAHPSAYVPQQETYALPNHGVKVVSTQMYNPSAGTATQADLASQRSKGKNQINQLMASAANFELQQARQGGSGKSNQRTGAKRKYGW